MRWIYIVDVEKTIHSVPTCMWTREESHTRRKISLKVKKKKTTTLHCNTHCVLLLCGIKVGFKSSLQWFEFYVDTSKTPGDCAVWNGYKKKKKRQQGTKLVGNSRVLASPEASFISRLSTDIIVIFIQHGGLTAGLGMKLIGRPVWPLPTASVRASRAFAFVCKSEHS